MPTPAPDIPQADPLEAALDARDAELQAAADAAFDRAQRKPTGANRDAYRKAVADLDQFRKDRREAGAAGRIFDGPPDVLAYLEAEQWKVGKSKLYDDIKTGRLPKRDDGRIDQVKVEEYARCFLGKLDGTPGTLAGVNLQEQKIREEISRISVDRQMRELKLEAERGETIRKSEMEIQFSKRAAYLRSDLKNVGRALSGEVVKKVGGDPALIPQFIAWWAGQGGVVDEIMDRYSRPVKGFEDE